MGFEVYPRWLVVRGLEVFRLSGRLPHPDELLDLPSAWVNDVLSLQRWIEVKEKDKGKDI